MSIFDKLLSLLKTPPQTPSAPAPAAVPAPAPAPRAVAPAPVPSAPASHPLNVVSLEPGERRKRERVNARLGTRALIIDDSATIVAALRKTLQSAGFVTLEALDGERGLEVAFREQPDIIFLDIVLPGMNGFAALRTMRKDPRTRTIPIIMMSGNEQATEEFYANRIGADDFMKKPFSRYEVFARIEKLLDANHAPIRKIHTPHGVMPDTPTTPAGSARG